MRRVRDSLRTNLGVLCFIIAGTLLFGGIFNLQSSVITRNYIETTGVVSDIEVSEVLRHGRYETRYNYDVTWYADGEEYSQHLTKQVDLPEEGLVTLWMSSDNRDFRFREADEIAKEGYIFILIAFTAGGLGIFLHVIRKKKRQESGEKRMERLEDIRIYSIIAFVCSLFGEGIAIACSYSDYQKNEFGFVDIDLLTVFGITAIISLIIDIVIKRRIRKHD